MSELAVQERTPVQAIIELASSGQAVDIDVFRGLMEIRKEMEAEEARKAYSAAMSRAQAQMPIIQRDKRNKHTNSTYASYEQVDKSIRPIYTGEGLSLAFNTGDSPEDGFVRYSVEIRHEAGHCETKSLDLPADNAGMRGTSNKNAVQALGSSATYAKRYLVFMSFGLSQSDDPDDDDGQASGESDARRLLAMCNAVRDNWSSIECIKAGIQAGDLDIAAQAWDELTNEDMAALWIAPSKGGIFTTEERRIIHSDEFAALRPSRIEAKAREAEK